MKKFLIVSSVMFFAPRVLAMEQALVCSICLSSIDAENKVQGSTLFGCSHEYDFDCIKKLIRTCIASGMPVKCPECRAQLQLPLPAGVDSRVQAALYAEPYTHEELMAAVRTDDANRLQQLADDGVDVCANGDEALLAAVIPQPAVTPQYKWKALQRLVELGANVQVGGNKPLRTVLTRGKLALVPLLITRGADVRVSDNMPLRAAVRAENVELINFLVEHGADVNAGKEIRYRGKETPLKLAIESGNVDVVRRLIELGAHVSVDAFKEAMDRRQFEMLDCFLAARAHFTDALLRHVAQSDRLDLIRWCFDRGLSNPAAIQQAFYRAVKSFNIEYAQWLLEHGADVNVDDGKALTCAIDYIHEQQHVRYTEHYDYPRSEEFEPEVIKKIRWLAAHGANEESKKHALRYAAHQGFNGVVCELIRLGVDPNIDDGFLAQEAIKSHNLDELMKLTELGAHVQDEKFVTLAEEAHDERIMCFLRIVRR